MRRGHENVLESEFDPEHGRIGEAPASDVLRREEHRSGDLQRKILRWRDHVEEVQEEERLEERHDGRRGAAPDPPPSDVRPGGEHPAPVGLRFQLEIRRQAQRSRAILRAQYIPKTNTAMASTATDPAARIPSGGVADSP